MRKSQIPKLVLAAFLCASPMLQACATETRTTYTTSDPTYDYPDQRTTTTTYTTSEPDSVVGSTAHAAGTIIAAPFRIVGDALGTIF